MANFAGFISPTILKIFFIFLICGSSWGTELDTDDESRENLKHIDLTRNKDQPKQPSQQGPKASGLLAREDNPEFIVEDEDDFLTTKKPRKPTQKPKRAKKTTPNPSDEEEEYEDNEEIVESQPDGSKKPKKPKPGVAQYKGKVIFEETFSDRSWDATWTYSKMEFKDGDVKKKFEKMYRIRSKRGNKGYDYGLVTSNKGAEEYAISAAFPPINSNDAPLVIQYSIHYQSNPHCQYVYLKLFDCRFKPEEFTSESPYLVQLGPNICGAEKQLSVVIMDVVKGEKYVVSEKTAPVTSKELHMYSFYIHPDGNYHIFINDKSVQNGSLTTVFPNFQGFPSICAVGFSIWHSILDKFFKGQIILDDVLVSSDLTYAERKRAEILDIAAVNNTS